MINSKVLNAHIICYRNRKYLQAKHGIIMLDKIEYDKITIDDCIAIVIETHSNDYVGWFIDVPVCAEGNTKDECVTNLTDTLLWYIEEIRDES